MTTQISSTPASTDTRTFTNKIPGVTFFKNLRIGTKLVIGFGIMVIITMLAVVFSYGGSIPATQTIDRATSLRFPTALDSSSAQTDLLRMLGDMQSYLALGDQEYRDRYNQSSQAFKEDLEKLRTRSANFDPDDQQRIDELKLAFDEWSKWPDRLFELRNDQLEREPAYKLLATDGIQLGGTVLIKLGEMIEIQRGREATAQNIVQLASMAKFQGSFASMLSGLRGYVTTRNRAFQGEYEANLAINNFAWDDLIAKKDSLDQDQQVALAEIAKNRADFLKLPGQIFEIMEGERYREDLYLFRTQAVPQAQKMQYLLAEITNRQQTSLQSELNAGRTALFNANRLTLAGGVIALILGIGLAFIFRENIAGPVRRLTRVAERIREGDLEARAQVESADEIGTLAGTFNNMTGQLRQTLFQVRKEKKRADDLLHVVIPIGVELSSEKDFNRLLEKMLVEAKQFCRADAGVVYLKENNRLKFVIVRNDTLKIVMGGAEDKEITHSRLPVALPVYDDETTPGAEHQSIAAHSVTVGQTLNIADAYQPDVVKTYGPGIFDEKTDYHSVSYLTIPLKNSEGEVLGVLQLINAQDPETTQVIPFDANLQQMMESYSSLAVAALEAYIREQSLKQQIQQLRIEIDEAKRQKQVSEIVDTDFFQDLQAKARQIRSRRSGSGEPGKTPPSGGSGQ